MTPSTRVERDSTCALVTVLGPAGIGKSRLAAELAAEVGGRATVLAGRCPPYGEGITFRPLAEIVSAAGDLSVHLGDEPDAALVADRLSAGSAAPPQDVFWAARRLFEAIARRGPLVLVWDDLHWAEPTLLDLVDHLAGLVRDVPLLLVALARPELLDARPHWGGGKLNATSTLLEPLSDDESQALVQDISSDLPAAVGSRIVAAAEGNPLFLEQMVAHARDDPGGDTAVPPTISALLAARLDRLPATERAALQRAAVVGREFEAGAVAALAEQDPRPALDALAHKDLIRHAVRGNGTFRFRHALIRDAAYGSLPKRTRGELHERFAATLDAAGEHDELIGYHLEHAYRYGEELAAPDAEPRRSAPPSGSARPGAAPPGARTPRPEPRCSRGRRRCCPTARRSGWRSCRSWPTPIAPSATSTARGSCSTRRSTASDERVVWHARSARIGLLLRTEKELRPDELLAEADEAIAAFERLGDERGLALSWSFRAWVPWLQGQAGATAEAARKSIEHARSVGDPLTENRGLRLLLGAALWGPTPVDEGLRLCDEILERPGTYGRVTHATALRASRRLRGHGRQRSVRARARRARAGAARGARADPHARSRGRGARPRRAARRRSGRRRGGGAAGVRDRGLGARRPDARRDRGPRARRGRRADEAALELADDRARRDAVGGPDDPGAVARADGAPARAAGEQAEAERLAREGVELAARTDFLSLQGDAWADLAHVLAGPGRGASSSALDALRAQGQRRRRGAAHRGAALSDSPTTPGQSRIGTSDRTRCAPDSAKRANAASASSV